MGCVSSTLLNQDKQFPKLSTSATFGRHIVSLTSTTYGFLTLDNPLPQPPSPPDPPVETINSWDLMSGLDPDDNNDENTNPNVNSFLDKFEMLCPPRGEKTVADSMKDDSSPLHQSTNNLAPQNSKFGIRHWEKRVVLYTTSLRGVRKTFEDCETLRSVIRGLGIAVLERDVSMDRGFRDELRELMKGKGSEHLIPPRLFIDGRYVGGVEDVIKIVEDGGSVAATLLRGLPRSGSAVCGGCGGVGFLPCNACHGSCKQVKGGFEIGMKKRIVVLKCSDCNENGLVLCPICS